MEIDQLKDVIRILADERRIPQCLFIGNIDPESMLSVRHAVRKFKVANPDISEIDFIVQSPGGSAADAYRIIRTLRTNFEKVNVVVPFWAKSAATLLSLGGSTIILEEFGEFGALDAQIGKAREDGPFYERESALNDENSLSIIETRFKELYESMYTRIHESENINIPRLELSRQLLETLPKFYEPLLKQINPYKLGEKRRILRIGQEYALRILLTFKTTDLQIGRNFVEFLVDGCPDHGYVIDYLLVKRVLGDKVLSSKELGTNYEEILRDISFIFIEEGDEFPDTVEFIMPTPLDNVGENEQKNSSSIISGSNIPHNGNGNQLQQTSSLQKGDKKTNNHGTKKNHKSKTDSGTELVGGVHS